MAKTRKQRRLQRRRRSTYKGGALFCRSKSPISSKPRINQKRLSELEKKLKNLKGSRNALGRNLNDPEVNILNRNASEQEYEELEKLIKEVKDAIASLKEGRDVNLSLNLQ